MQTKKNFKYVYLKLGSQNTTRDQSFVDKQIKLKKHSKQLSFISFIIRKIIMLVVISPAKKLNVNSSLDVIPTKPVFSQNALELASIANNLSITELRNLMGISESLAKLNADRFASFGKQKTMPAALAFAGDTYKGLNADTFNNDDIEWAQNHLRIISGLYGLLRPLDKIEPYRLEMGSKLKTPNGNSLYDYWDKTISLAINKLSEDTNSKILVTSRLFSI